MASPSPPSIVGYFELKPNEIIHIEILNNPSKSYSPGQSVEGRMTVHTRRPEEVKEIIIQLEGEGEVRWKEGKKTYSATEQYVHCRHSLYGDGQNIRLLPAGTFVYPFRFDLPNDLPSTFSSYNHSGKVTYILKGEIRRPLFTINDRAIVPLTVIGRLDLNLVEVARCPQQCRKTKESNFLCCRMGDINLNLSIPTKSGFIPGEVVNFQAEITNYSNSEIFGSKAYFLQVVTFKTERGSKVIDELEEDEAGLEGPRVEVGEHEVWNGSLTLPVSDLPPTGLGGICGVIDLKYFLCVKLRIEGLSPSLTGKLPIVIGTIPLRSVDGECSPSPPGYNQV